MSKLQRTPYLQWGIFALAFLLVAWIFVSFFERFPIEGTSLAIDWRGLWSAVQGADIHYAPSNGTYNPPWGLLPALPLGLLSMRASWGMLVLITTLILIVSVPRTTPRWRYWLSVLLLTVSFLALRHAADGNFEGLVIAGVLLILYGYQRRQVVALAVGILVATVKPQEVLFLLIPLGFYVLATFPMRTWLKLGLVVGAVVGLSLLWRGASWLTAFQGVYQAGTAVDITLRAALSRAGMPQPLTLVVWAVCVGALLYFAWITRYSFSREKAGLFIAASLLLAPYSGANSILSVLAIGIIPLFQKRPWWGGLLIFLSDAALFLNDGRFTPIVGYYWTAYLLLTCALLVWRVNHSLPSSP